MSNQKTLELLVVARDAEGNRLVELKGLPVDAKEMTVQNLAILVDMETMLSRMTGLSWRLHAWLNSCEANKTEQ
jgi:hypothetical protein